ncbi:MAG: hypothetical protein NT149_03495 [Candidatus Gottesmanbacteria bacterium]|nr:hypothetical protein [Candidatus Gottesmanbacteria bacterium]
MFRPEWPTPSRYSLAPLARETLDRLDAHSKKAYAQESANYLVQLLLKNHIHHTKLDLPNERILDLTLSNKIVNVRISQDTIKLLPVIRSTAEWNVQTKELLWYDEFDTQGLRVGSVQKNLGRLSENEPAYKAIDNRDGIRAVDFDIELQRKVYDRVAIMFTLAQNALALEKTRRRLLSPSYPR